MNTVTGMLELEADRTPKLAIFLSGSGSNAERILERIREAESRPVEVSVLVTDAPETSRARALGRMFDLPVVAEDIRRFYAENGEPRVSIATPRGQELRRAWTHALREKLAPHTIDFAVFAGFVPLTNLAADFPCLNVHPGDLTYLKDGKRYLVGLHTVPIERAILEGLDCLRSSVIRALPYTGTGDDMDSGPILGISQPVRIDLAGHTLADLAARAATRPPTRPKGGFGDALAEIAACNQETLKEQGDWTVLPRVVFDYALGRFGSDSAGTLYYRIGADWHPIETVVYGRDSRELVFSAK